MHKADAEEGEAGVVLGDVCVLGGMRSKTLLHVVDFNYGGMTGYTKPKYFYDSIFKKFF